MTITHRLSSVLAAAALAAAAASAGTEPSPAVYQLSREEHAEWLSSARSLDATPQSERRAALLEAHRQAVELAAGFATSSSLSLADDEWRVVRSDGTDVRCRLPRALVRHDFTARGAAGSASAGCSVSGPDDGVLLVTKVSADEQQKLQLPDGLQPTPDPEAEQQLFDLVNRERTSRGLKALTLDPRLVPVARAHAAEMFRLKYFGHQSPTTGSPFDRLRAARITYSRAGENLAYAQSVAVAHQGLMESPGHRENILRPEFTRLGIGVMSAGAYGKMVTQLFITP
jgi:uncharacterized protein YkwD